MVRRTQSRRGVVILIVLSLLVLFVLLVVTFAIVAGQYRRAAQAVGRREWLGEDPQKTADRVMYALLREPDVNHTGSPFRGHALLTDVYGRYFKATVTGTAVSRAGGQIVEFNFLYPSSWSVQPNEKLRGYFNGSVLTFVSTSATSQLLQGVSTRVVAYAYTPASPPNPEYGTVRIVNPQNDGTALPLPQNGDTFVLNGKPFVGTGFGYDSAASPGVPRLSDDTLKPNRWGDASATVLTWLAGGANESYDAADYQNLILAAVAYDPARSSMRVLPSFHREELIAYWMARDTSPTDAMGWNMLGGTSDTRYTDYPAISPPPTPSPFNIYSNLSAANFNLRHKLVFRPMPWDHPNFTGSNVAFDASSRSAQQIDDALAKGWVDLNGNGVFENNEVAWDVDNDGDGIKDSIWIDPDLPIQTTEDGRVFRPLVAVLSVDMDGRLNVNSHGNSTHVTALANFVNVTLAGGVDSATLPKGQGYGPPEVNLLPVFSGDATQYQALLARRYGADTVPGVSGYDPLMPFRFFEYPNNYFSPSFLTSFMSNMDLRGVFACGADHRGQPLYEGIYDLTTPAFPDQLADSPYELNLNTPSAADAPFTVAEMEKVLRYHDFDGPSLQSRLTDASGLTFLQGSSTAAQAARRSVTTDSWDMPVPGVVVPDDRASGMAGYLNPPYNIISLLYDSLYRSRLSPTIPVKGGCSGWSLSAINTEISKLLSPDLMMGLRMDINRPIGNGRDDNANGIVDEHSPYAAAFGFNESANATANGEQIRIGAATLTTPPTSIDHDNDGTFTSDSDAFLARHYLARHLYVLMLTLKDEAAPLLLNTDGSDDGIETQRNIAQWAINVVDFRDADSIMTPFEYDTNPFDGWDVDGIPTDRGADGVDNDGDGTADEADEQEPGRDVVWGCERPELLLSSTLALHDRRTEDLDTDPTGSYTPGTDPSGTDGDFDQRLRPRGSLFVELYNPWAGHDRSPAEFYYNGAWSPGVVLNKVVAGAPVWRLAITAEDPGTDGPIEPTGANIERTVYFASPASLTGANLGTQMHYTTIADLAPLLPGRYAVVGSSGVLTGGEYVTTVGRRTDADEATSLALDKTRQIVLAPDSDPSVNQVLVRNNVSPPATPGDATTVDPPMDGFTTPPAQVQPAIAVPVDAVFSPAGPPLPLSLSITEPVGGYTDVDPTGAAFDTLLGGGEGAYPTPYDTPLDPPAPGGIVPAGNLTTANFRRVHLQRLANPLLAYHPVTNPYLTIDVMPLDLTVFNGVTTPPPADPVNPTGLTRFRAWSRGDSDTNAAPPYLRKLWPQERITAAITAPSPPESVPSHRFGFELQHTLGYLNTKYGPAFTVATAPAPPNFAVTNYVGSPDTVSPPASPPFQWLPWNNRPYVSPTELLLVPRTSSARLLWEFDVASGTPYDNPTGRFRHALNFFSTGVAPGTVPNLYRLFEYVTVRPRFAGTETMLNPSTTAPHFGSSVAGTDMLHPPFNWISNYREPGRINLNTIFPTQVIGGSLASSVWAGLWGAHQPLPLNDLVDNRRGYGAAGGNAFTASSAVPTYFANPYRATGSAALVPPVDTDGDSDARELMRLEVDASLLRTNRPTMGPTPPGSEVPRFLNAFADAPRNSDRNPYFSYQALQRLSNLVTCRSNVYALWLTIGYFEVEGVNAAGQPILGQEVGLDTGTVKRHRAFYIIDRSIPVAFEPGQNHNVDKCVLLRRFIE